MKLLLFGFIEPKQSLISTISYGSIKFVPATSQIVYLIYLALNKYLIQSNRFDNCDSIKGAIVKEKEREREHGVARKGSTMM